MTGEASEQGVEATQAGSVPSPYAELLALQDQDVLAEQLRYRRAHLAEREAVTDRHARLQRLEREAGALGSQREELASRRDQLEGEAEQLTARARRIEERLSGGGAASFRDQEAMATEVASLSRHRESLEDEALELMEKIEPLEQRLGELAAEGGALQGELAAARRELAAAQAAVDQELSQAAARRASLAAALPAPLLAEYTRLAERLGGVAAARLVRGTCAGCHLGLSATELDRIRHAPAGSVFHCEQCGRILVPLERSGQAG